MVRLEKTSTPLHRMNSDALRLFISSTRSLANNAADKGDRVAFREYRALNTVYRNELNRRNS